MAIAGGACSAYRCWVIAGELFVSATTRLRTDCATVDDAIQRLSRGEAVTVAGADMPALRRVLAREGVRG